MQLVFTSILAFASTNIDDIFLLMLYFGGRRYTEKSIVTGQYLGFLILIAISFIGSLLELVVDTKYIGLLGLIPIYLGVKGIIEKHKTEKNGGTDFRSSTFRSPVLAIASVTFANGGDNIGIYIPLFASLSVWQRLVMIFIFLFLIAIWCLLAKYLTRHPLVGKAMDKYGHIIAPYILILLGLYILYENQTFELLSGE
ncbi:MAG: cadmium resistance transporter [Chitinophagaceae bacterium]